MNKWELYHVHRKGIKDELWYQGNALLIDDSFNTIFYERIQEDEEALKAKYGDYDIDLIIKYMERLKIMEFSDKDFERRFNIFLNQLYFLRREKALEMGRLIYKSDAPSRYHSLYLSNESDLSHWQQIVGKKLYDSYLLELDGKIFETSDELFPRTDLPLEAQIEEARKYWQPNLKRTRHKEYLFQGKCFIKDIK